MAHYVQLSDSDIHRIVGSSVSGSIYQELAELAIRIAVREKGRKISIGYIEDVLHGMSRLLSSSATSKIIRKLEDLYDEQQEKAA